VTSYRASRLCTSTSWRRTGASGLCTGTT
jgi:hypothetical protein